MAADLERACTDMLMLCGELGGMQPGEQPHQYLRRLLDHVVGAPDREAVATMVYEAIRWASFCAGEGLGPATDCIDPVDVFIGYGDATDRDLGNFDTLAADIRDRIMQGKV